MSIPTMPFGKFSLLLAIVALISPARAAETLRLAGSDTLGAKLVPQLSELYRTKVPGLQFQIAAEGSSSAFEALLQGTADIGMSNRDIKPAEAKRLEERGIRWRRLTVAHDMLAIVVNAKNPVQSLTGKQVEQIFTGDVVNWKSLGGPDTAIVPYLRNSASGTYRDFRALAMNGRDYAPVKKLPLGEQIVHMVARDDHGVTYCGIAYAKASGVKSLMIDGKEPTAANLDTYPFTCGCYFFHRVDAPRQVLDFARWAAGSEEAREVARKIGFVPGK